MTACLACLAFLAPPLARAQGYQPLEGIQETAKNFIQQQLPNPGGRLEIDAGALDTRLRLPACAETLEAFSPPGGRRTGNTSVGVRCHQPKPWSIYVPVNVKIHATVLTARLALRRGDVIGAEDFQLVERDVAALPEGHFSTPEQIVGRIAKRPVTAGSPYTPAMLEAPRLVRKGDLVTLLAEIAGVNVRMTGKALADGAAGTSIQVSNLSSQRVIEGTVIAEGVVKVRM
ncbi:MAG: flagellar basal body P-ring formation protein FlgA [Gammaproteobacteria bacterium]|nr:flagellar basal body P-ring formation protein FlgA [Gammaproteobacteria bacterium]